MERRSVVKDDGRDASDSEKGASGLGALDLEYALVKGASLAAEERDEVNVSGFKAFARSFSC